MRLQCHCLFYIEMFHQYQQLASTIILGLLLIGIGKQYNKFLIIINDGKIPEFLDDDELKWELNIGKINIKN